MTSAILAFHLVWPPLWGIVLAVLAVIFGGIFVTVTAGPNMAAVGVTPDDQLLVRPVGLMRIWAFHSGVDLPVTSISDVGVAERRSLARGIKLPGSAVPGLITAGTYRVGSERNLWMVGRAKRVLVIELHGEKYRHLVVEVEDPEAATEALRAAMHRER